MPKFFKDEQVNVYQGAFTIQCQSHDLAHLYVVEQNRRADTDISRIVCLYLQCKTLRLERGLMLYGFMISLVDRKNRVRFCLGNLFCIAAGRWIGKGDAAGKHGAHGGEIDLEVRQAAFYLDPADIPEHGIFLNQCIVRLIDQDGRLYPLAVIGEFDVGDLPDGDLAVEYRRPDI